MSRSRGRPTQRRSKGNSGTKQTEIEHIQEHKPPVRLSPQPLIRALSRPRLRRNLRRAWKFGTVVSAAVGFAIAFRPQITIEESVNLDTTTAFGTQFKIANQGKISIVDVHFGCAVNAPPMLKNFESFSNGREQRPIKRLEPGQSVTRGCGISAHNLNAAATIDYIVSYRWPLIGSWPLIGRKVSISTRFTTRRAVNGEIVLVPDVD
jgi:hypothetical protein